MIITRTPLRISIAGGGTDFPDFYLEHGGCVVSTAIDRYIYVILKRRFGQSIRVNYSQTENVENLDNLKHELVRECLRRTGLSDHIEVATLADVPSRGTGLGSSSALTVGLLLAMFAFKGEMPGPETLADEACKIEIDVLDKPIGKQDQYIAAFGGMRLIRFERNGSVCVDPITVSDNLRHNLSRDLLLFHLDIDRDSMAILSEQRANIGDCTDTLLRMKREALELADELRDDRDQGIGQAIRSGWAKKQTLSSGIATPEVEDACRRALVAGADAVKITGAGGGGFLLVYCKSSYKADLRDALSDMQELQFNIGAQGARVVYRE